MFIQPYLSTVMLEWAVANAVSRMLSMLTIYLLTLVMATDWHTGGIQGVYSGNTKAHSFVGAFFNETTYKKVEGSVAETCNYGKLAFE